ncbi:VanZ like family protein [Sporotomaculum syntrophicum]|uniref:VanZ like family protein n=1 Tax=Sporotomaculum syntrophicum TaxID=182264 RepID=A0A9D3AWL3_9FIRM|nr:VanZ family protein [Sporotomaculum syntrophicum]KAF1085585.1 VanZ like family protein [Sporotomaculum syntrophicum]
MYWIPAIFWMALIFYLSGRTGSELQYLFPLIDNFNPGHLIAYFVLGLLFYLALHRYNHRHPYWQAMLFCFLYGITDEIHQYFVPTRYPDIYDLARDLLGAGLGLATVYLLKRRTKS